MRDYDVLVVGGGFSGLWTALLSAEKGSRTALVEAKEIGHLSCTSCNSLGVLHGGLRYLQQANFLRYKESIRARCMWQERVPSYLSMQRFAIPLGISLTRNRTTLTAALYLNDRLTASIQPSSVKWPRSKILDQDSLENNFHLPSLGWATWYEATIERAQGAAVELARQFVEAGGSTYEYHHATSLDIDDSGKVRGLHLCGEPDGIDYLHSGIVVDATNGQMDCSNLDQLAPVNWVVGANLILDMRLSNTALGFTGSETSRAFGKPQKREFFFLPYGHNQTIAGTTYAVIDRDTDTNEIESRMKNLCLTELNSVLDQIDFSEQHVSGVRWGWLPLDSSGKLLAHTQIANRSRTHGYWKLTTGKLTTAPTTAEVIVKRLANNH